jgi:hypothetical protein
MCVPSIRVRTRCVSTAWHGGCERSELTCSDTEISQIFTALCAINRKVESCGLSGLGGLKECLLNSFNTVVWKCASLGPGVVAQSSGNEITLTPGAFSSTSARFEAIVFHELIHHCGGTELDSEAFENHCYAGAGATFPTSGDWPKFRDDGGNFVNWNRTSGTLTTTAGDVLSPSFPDPDPSAGGDDGWV